MKDYVHYTCSCSWYACGFQKALGEEVICCAHFQIKTPFLFVRLSHELLRALKSPTGTQSPRRHVLGISRGVAKYMVVLEGAQIRQRLNSRLLCSVFTGNVCSSMCL